jgi:hypothetical protein
MEKFFACKSMQSLCVRGIHVNKSCKPHCLFACVIYQVMPRALYLHMCDLLSHFNLFSRAKKRGSVRANCEQLVLTK